MSDRQLVIVVFGSIARQRMRYGWLLYNYLIITGMKKCKKDYLTEVFYTFVPEKRIR